MQMSVKHLPSPTNAAGERVVDGYCTQCKQTKSAKAFSCEWNRSKTRRKLRAWCRVCRAVYDREKRNDPVVRERIRQINREYYKTPQRRAQLARARKRYRKRCPEKLAARTAVQMAVRRGDLIYTGICVHCYKKRKTGFHHDDYSRPLDVVELCKACHKIADATVMLSTLPEGDER